MDKDWKELTDLLESHDMAHFEVAECIYYYLSCFGEEEKNRKLSEDLIGFIRSVVGNEI